MLKLQTLGKTALALAAGAFMFTACSDDDSSDSTPGTKATSFTTTESTVFNDDGDSLYTFEQVTIQDYGKGVGNYTFENDKVYVLDGLVFVNDGDKLTVEPGTIIKGQAGAGVNASALVVARGGEIEAIGSASEPIIMTSILDDIVRDKNGVLQANDDLLTSSGLWGGLIILGKAVNNKGDNRQIEGIVATETRGQYGGTDDADDSGTIKYLSIRYGGTEIGAGNEINGLTMGSVGTGTDLSYIEVYKNKDDGFEWFGGAVGVDYLVSAYCGDDAVDYDHGWTGDNSYWFIYQDDSGDNGGEHDNDGSDFNGSPYSNPTIDRATFIGGGSGRALRLREGAAGTYKNSLFSDYEVGFRFENNGSATQKDSYERLKDGEFSFKNNIIDNNISPLYDASGSYISTSVFDAEDYIEDNNTQTNSPFNTTGIVSSYTSKGAFDHTVTDMGNSWVAGWTALAQEKGWTND